MRGRATTLAVLATLGLAACANPTAEPTPTPTSASPTSAPTPSPTPSDSAAPTPTASPTRATARPQSTTPTPAPSPSATPQPSSATPTPATTGTPSAASPTPSASVASGRWRDVESEASTPAAVKRLAGVPESFKTYVAAQMSGPDADGCTTTYVGVMSVHPSGFVLGSEASDCGGGQVVWKQVGGSWERAVTLQAVPECSQLSGPGIPEGIGLQCTDGTATRTY